MEDDLEEELLAVAGRSRVESKKRGRKAAESSDEDYEMEEQQKPRRQKKAAQTRARAESDEDGEVGSASDFDDGYGSDLMGDDDDRARLAEMTELDREMELAERSERRDEIKERRQTARVLRQQQRTAAKASNMRSSTRQKGTDVAKKSAMAELVAAKKAQARKSSKEGQKRKSRRGEEDEDEEVSDESEYEVSDRSEREASPEEEEEEEAPSSEEYSREREWDRRREEVYSDKGEEGDDDGVMTRQFHGDEESEDAEYKHIKDIQVRRFMLEKWQNEPFFERSLPGAVVRIAVGSNRYFLAQIVHVEERAPGSYKDPGLFRIQSPYEFPEKGPKTHKWLYVQRGTSPRLMPMHLVSNHGITPEEFESWRSQCEKDNRPQITTAEVDEVKDLLNKAHSYVYTTADVTKMVEDKRARGEVGNMAKEKSRLVVKRAKALEDKDFELAETLQAQLAEMETRANLKAQRERDLKGAGDVEKGRKSLAEVNRQNALKNMENALKNVSSRPEGSRTLTSDGVDPFSRRPTRPMTYWKTRKDDVPETPAKVEAGGEEDEEMEDADPNAPTATATENAAGGIDLNIDLSALQQSPEAALLSNRLLGPHWAARLPTRQDFAGRKTLTLADYKRRQGIV